MFSRRSRKMLPPGLLISSRPIFFPESEHSLAGGGDAWGRISFPGWTKVTGISFPPLFVRNRIRDHLAAGGPASQHGRKFSRGASGHEDLERLGRTKFLIAALALNGDFAILGGQLRSFTVVLLCIIAKRDAGIFKKKLPHLLFA